MTLPRQAVLAVKKKIGAMDNTRSVAAVLGTHSADTEVVVKTQDANKHMRESQMIGISSKQRLI
jgi:hypothetical protein